MTAVLKFCLFIYFYLFSFEILYAHFSLILSISIVCSFSTRLFYPGGKNATPVTLFKLVSKTKLVDLFGSSVDLISGWCNFSFSWVKSCDLLPLLIIIIINHFCSTHIFLELKLMLFWCVLFNNHTQITLITNFEVYVQY